MMKKYYYITIIGTIAIIYLQGSYINRLHNNYIEEKITEINESVQFAITEELNLRTRDKIKRERHMYYKRASDMTPQERDSLTSLSKGDTIIHFEEARKEGLGKTLDDLFFQIEQDQAMQSGLFLNLEVLDSLFKTQTKNTYLHTFVLYDQKKIPIDSIGFLRAKQPTYSSNLLPVGTKSLQYLQIKASVQNSEFIAYQFQTLVLSAGLMLLVLLCLIYQLTIIHQKNKLLIKRETSVNGTIHDLKAPLNSIVTMLSWFRMSNQDPQTIELVELGQARVKHLVYNIESLLITARKDRQKIVLNKTNVDILSLIKLVKMELTHLYQGKSHKINIINNTPSNNTVYAYADAMYVENVIRNLIENSLKYSDEEVLVEVILSIEENMFVVSVKDNGWGIAPKYQRKLFKQFYQVPRGQDRDQKGYGIGLAHARNVIREHGGDIKVISMENNGSEFRFTIPAYLSNEIF